MMDQIIELRVDSFIERDMNGLRKSAEMAEGGFCKSEECITLF